MAAGSGRVPKLNGRRGWRGRSSSDSFIGRRVCPKLLLFYVSSEEWRDGMSVPCKFERSLLGHDEYETIRLTHHPTIYEVEPAELEAIRSRLRKMRAN